MKSEILIKAYAVLMPNPGDKIHACDQMMRELVDGDQIIGSLNYEESVVLSALLSLAQEIKFAQCTGQSGQMHAGYAQQFIRFKQRQFVDLDDALKASLNERYPNLPKYYVCRGFKLIRREPTTD